MKVKLLKAADPNATVVLSIDPAAPYCLDCARRRATCDWCRRIPHLAPEVR